MRFGFQTILWGQDPVDYARMLDVIEDAGFQGVEFFQHPSDLPPLDQLLALLQKRHLELLGMSGGALRARIDYLSARDDFSPKLPYLYVDEWNDEAAKLLGEGFRLAVHPHYLKQINSNSHAFNLLNRYTKLGYIPDTAHSEIKRENILHGLSTFNAQLAAVHLKDWRPGFGRASALYARGFTELGNGIVHPERTLAYLRDNLRYQGWVVVEQDYTEDLAEESVQIAARFLKNLDQERPYIQPALKLVPRPLPPRELPGDKPPVTLTAVHQFISQRFASQDVGQIYQRVAEALQQSLNVPAVAIWSCSELEGILTLHGFAPRPDSEPSELTTAFEGFESLPEGSCQDSSEIHPEIERLLPKPACSIRRCRFPVKSTWNPHHTRIVVDLYSLSGEQLLPKSQAFLSRSIARVFDSHLDRIASSSAADLNNVATIASDDEDFGLKLKELIKKRLQCDAVALFLVDRSGTRLLPFVSPELRWRVDVHPSERYYEVGDGQLTTRVWESKEPHFHNRRPSITLSKESKCRLPCREGQDRVLAMPIVDTKGRSIGLVRCANKLTPLGAICNFSDDDLVVLDHILQHALPTLRLRNAAKEEQRRLLLVGHEFKKPVSALAGIVDLMVADIEDEKERPRIPPYWARQILQTSRWTENLRSLVLRSKYLTGKPDLQFVVSRQVIELMGEIVAPTIAQLRWEIRAKKFPEEALKYDRFVAIPALYVDRGMFQQIFFNLLDNSIKYSMEDPATFGVDISTSDDGSHYVIDIRDKGIGIPLGMEESLFTLGARGPDAFRHAEGSGIGLWLVKQLVELHGGTIGVRANSNPTWIQVRLPYKLSGKNWKL